MISTNSEWKPIEDDWQSFEDTESYKRFKKKQNSRRSALKVLIHDRIGLNHEKALKTVRFHAEKSLRSLTKKRSWVLDVWIDETSDKSREEIICGVALKRPNKATIYSRKVAGSLNQAIKKSVKVLQNTLVKEI